MDTYSQYPSKVDEHLVCLVRSMPRDAQTHPVQYYETAVEHLVVQ